MNDLNVGDKIKLSPMWKYDVAFGTVKKVNKDGYVVVIWNGINGEWYYTPEQAKRLELVTE